MVAGDHKGLAHWAARALPRLSERVRAMEPAKMLAAGASFRLGGKLAREEGERPNGCPGWCHQRCPASRRRCGCSTAAWKSETPNCCPTRASKLPQTEPLLLTVIPARGATRTVELPPRLDPVVRVPVSGGAVRLRTLLGETFLLDAREGAAADRRAAEILDMTAERERHHELVGRERLLAELETLISASNGLLPGLSSRAVKAPASQPSWRGC